MVKKSDPLVTQLYGGLGLQMKKTSGYFVMNWPDTVKKWQESWFYYKDLPGLSGEDSLPSYTAGLVIQAALVESKTHRGREGRHGHADEDIRRPPK